MLASALFDNSSSHPDPVVPILLALVFLSAGAVIGGRLMTLLKQPAVLGELLVGLLASNLGYWLGSNGITVLRGGDNLRKISNLALTSSSTAVQGVFQALPANKAARVAAALSIPSITSQRIPSWIFFLASPFSSCSSSSASKPAWSK